MDRDGQSNFIMVSRNLRFKEGLQYMSKGDYPNAQLTFKNIIAAIKNDLMAKFQLARCYQIQRSDQLALQTYEEIFLKNKRDPRPVYQQACIYEINNDLDQAIKYYEKAAKILDNNQSEFKNDPKIGLKYEQINEIQKAKQTFQTFIQFSSISDKTRQRALQKISELASKILEGSQQTQQYKNNINDLVRKQQQHPSYIKQQQNIKQQQEEERNQQDQHILEAVNSQNSLNNNNQQNKDENDNKNEQRKPGDSNLSQPSTTAGKYLSIQVPSDDNSLNFQNNIQQQQYKFLNQPTYNNIVQPHQNNINTTSVDNYPQNTNYQQNFPLQQTQSPSKINSINYQISSHQQQQQNKMHTYAMKQQPFQQIQQVYPASDIKWIQSSQSNFSDLNVGNPNVNISKKGQDARQSYQSRQNRLTFDPTSSAKDIFTNNNRESKIFESTKHENNNVNILLLEDEDEEILKEEEIPQEKDSKNVKKQQYLYPIEDQTEDLSDDDIPLERVLTMQNKSSFNNPNQIKNMFMKSFIDVAQRSSSKSRINGQSHLSNSRFSLMQDQSSQIKKNNFS